MSAFRNALERWNAEQGEGFEAVEARRSNAFDRWSAEQAERHAAREAERRAFELMEATRPPTEHERSVASLKARFGIE